MTDPAKCFEYLSHNVPLWIATLDELQAKIKDRQPNLSRVPVPMRKVKRAGSDESLRTRSSGGGDDDTERGGAPAATGVAARSNDDLASAPQDGHMAMATQAEQRLGGGSSGGAGNQRKRKTASIVSFASVPHKYRARSMVVVYYDSDIQKTFEQVVRHIGSGRNNIRKMRLAARMEALAVRSEISSFDKIRALSRPARRAAQADNFGGGGAAVEEAVPEENDPYATADAALEQAQSMCERGAHQFLREGECEAEIVGAKKNFEKVKRVSDHELERLRRASAIRAKAMEGYGSMNVEPIGDESGSEGGDLLEVDEEEDGAGLDEMINKYNAVREAQRMM